MSGAPLEIRAAVLERHGRPVRVEQLLLHPPRHDEVLVRVAAAGVCHSDLHLAQGHLGDGRWPIVLGHEGAGVVEAVGESVTHVRPGDAVAFCFVPPCGSCRMCLRGRSHLCETAAEHSLAGMLMDGTSRLERPDGTTIKHFLHVSCFAERCVVPAGAAVPLGADLPLWQAALVGCGVVTGVGAVRNAAKVAPGESVCVIGCGGVGLQVVAGAKLAGAGRIVAVDRDPAKLALARARGATDTLEATGDVRAAVEELAPGGFDHAIEAIGRGDTIRLAWDVLRPGGQATVVGIAPAGVEVSLPALDLLNEKTLRGCYYGSADVAAELPGLVRLAAAGQIDLAAVISHVTDLDGVEEALQRLRRGEGARTIVIVDEQLAGHR
ncbi:MAG TPA: alcohol dehydrogenase catalytic domain-containing protein [Gaiellales bacterium]|jgi:Zn-dependent alcohol dehydrogenase